MSTMSETLTRRRFLTTAAAAAGAAALGRRCWAPTPRTPRPIPASTTWSS